MLVGELHQNRQRVTLDSRSHILDVDQTVPLMGGKPWVQALMDLIHRSGELGTVRQTSA